MFLLAGNAKDGKIVDNRTYHNIMTYLKGKGYGKMLSNAMVDKKNQYFRKYNSINIIIM